MRAASGTLIEYATAPGTVAADGTGPHSPFTTALLHQFDQPGKEIHQVFAEVRREVREATRGRQVPWEASAMEGAFYFLPPAPQVPTATTATKVSQAPAAPKDGESRSRSDDAELLFWKSIADSRDAADFREYLASYPKGIYAGIAANKIRQLAVSAVPTPTTAVTAAPTAQAVAPRPPDLPDDHREILNDEVLGKRLLDDLTSVPNELRKKLIAEYLKRPLHRALMANPDQVFTWTSANYKRLLSGSGVLPGEESSGGSGELLM